jgi:hypothetical protein
MKGRTAGFAGCVAVVIALAGSSARAALVMSSATPAPNAMNVAATTSIQVTFAQPVMTSTVDGHSFGVFGRSTGPAAGTLAFSNGNRTVTLIPGHTFAAGEVVGVVLSHDLRAADGTFLRSAGYAWSFTVEAAPADMVFQTIDTMSNRSGSPTRIYGAMSSDLNHDGYPDLATVNEDSADLRVFMNKADGTGLYHPWQQPPYPIGVESSPNEPGDFDRDGEVDIAVVSADEDSVLVARGNGDGSFGASQVIGLGSEPHGVAVLDADGDGDSDLAVSVRGGNHLALMLNDGSGTLGAPTTFETGGNGEYGLAAADMNNDMIMDLVVGAIDSQQIIVMRGNGNGTFTAIATQSAGGRSFVVATGDVNGDGNVDVSSANENSANGTILLGNGSGGLSAPVSYSCTGRCVSTDLGDLDGDGDLDWVLSSYGAWVWRVFRNDGAGVFSLDQQFVAPSNPSCAIILDFDRDGDLDLALTDEIADVVVLKENLGSPPQVPAVPAWAVTALAGLLAAGGCAGARRARASAGPASR